MIKYKAFGKVTIGKKRKDMKLGKETKDKSEEEKAKLLIEEQTKLVNTELDTIKEKHKGKVGQVWEIRKRVIGGKKKEKCGNIY